MEFRLFMMTAGDVRFLRNMRDSAGWRIVRGYQPSRILTKTVDVK